MTPLLRRVVRLEGGAVRPSVFEDMTNDELRLVQREVLRAMLEEASDEEREGIAAELGQIEGELAGVTVDEQRIADLLAVVLGRMK